MANRDNYRNHELALRRERFRSIRPSKKVKKVSEINGIDVTNPDKKSVAKDLVFDGKLVRVWSPTITREKDVIQSLKNLAKYPDVFPYIAVMPDYHLGENSVNGSIIPSENLLYVNAIGGDIGCGMASLKLPFEFEEIQRNLMQIYKDIYARVPSGRRLNITPNERVNNLPIFDNDLEIMNNANTKRAKQQIGTLGGGNHFVEIQKNENGDINLMVHTGSRILGQHIRGINMKKGKTLDSPRGLVVLEAESDEGKDYLKQVEFAVQYAKENRQEILRQAYEAFTDSVGGNDSFESVLEKLIDVSHNSLSKENIFGKDVYVHRKGAVHLSDGELGLIPGSMGTNSYIVQGKGNKYSFESCSHGAGRKMSRGVAFSTIRKSDFLESMQGIISREDDSILDEAPQAYKDIGKVVKYQQDLVKVVEKLSPLACVKG